MKLCFNLEPFSFRPIKSEKTVYRPKGLGVTVIVKEKKKGKLDKELGYYIKYK